MKIRRARMDDAEQICSLHKASIRQLCSTCYSPEQIEAWSGALEPKHYWQAIEMFDFFVAEEELVVGFLFLSMDKAEVNALYLDPAVVGRGIGRQMLDYAEDLARQQSVTEMQLKSTLNAVGFYEACGYVRIKESIHQNPFGLELTCVEMRKRL